MNRAVRITDKVIGMTSGEHSGHILPHSPCEITGEIVEGCSHNVLINGLKASRIGVTTIERDCCCGSDYGEVIGGSSKVFINGLGATRVMDDIKPHNGEVRIDPSPSNASKNVIIY